MMMIEEMGIVLIEEAAMGLLKEEAIVGDHQAHTEEIEVVLITDVVRTWIQDMSPEEVPSMREPKAQ